MIFRMYSKANRLEVEKISKWWIIKKIIKLKLLTEVSHLCLNINLKKHH